LLQIEAAGELTMVQRTLAKQAAPLRNACSGIAMVSADFARYGRRFEDQSFASRAAPVASRLHRRMPWQLQNRHD
jgi:hypothetical protein